MRKDFEVATCKNWVGALQYRFPVCFRDDPPQSPLARKFREWDQSTFPHLDDEGRILGSVGEREARFDDRLRWFAESLKTAYVDDANGHCINNYFGCEGASGQVRRYSLMKEGHVGMPPEFKGKV